MLIIRDNDTDRQLPECAATIGFFDGVHRGHRFLIDKVRGVAHDNGLASAVITFTNHPRTVTVAGASVKLLSTFDEKMQLLGTTGLDECFVLDFDHDMARMTAHDFMAEVLRKRFNVRMLVIGYDHRFGHDRRESFEDYKRYGEELGIEVVRAEGMAGGEHEISSSLIRRSLASGNVRRAGMALGRNYSITGRVVEGYKIGRRLGFPTANISLPADKLAPAGGVYAVTTRIGGRTWDGMLNIGSRPTFDQHTGPTVEMHIFDFDKDIYGKTLTVEFVEKVRDEHKFDSPEQLADQLKEDERHIKTMLYIERNQDADPRSVALKGPSDKSIDYAYAATQIEGLHIARRKLPLFAMTPGIAYPRHLSMEQCSSQMTAEFKATLVNGKSLIDLTGGFGVDCIFMSRRFETVTYVERNPELCDIMRHNLPLLDADNISVVNAEATDFIAKCGNADIIFADPARRDTNGSKTVTIKQCEPDLTLINDIMLAKADKSMVKLSPMLDLTAATNMLKGVAQVYVVSAGGECKELLVIMQRNAPDVIEIKAVNLTKEGTDIFTFTKQEEEKALPAYARGIGAYLYEPNPSIMKAGAFKTVAVRYGVEKIAPSTHLYTSDTAVTDFPGRCLKVIAVHDFSKQSLRELARQCPRANIATRNFPLSPDELRKRLRIGDGGDVFIYATSLADHSKVLAVAKKE